jgi:hypothetical protein
MRSRRFVPAKCVQWRTGLPPNALERYANDLTSSFTCESDDKYLFNLDFGYFCNTPAKSLFAKRNSVDRPFSFAYST